MPSSSKVMPKKTLDSEMVWKRCESFPKKRQEFSFSRLFSHISVCMPLFLLLTIPFRHTNCTASSRARSISVTTQLLMSGLCAHGAQWKKELLYFFRFSLCGPNNANADLCVPLLASSISIYQKIPRLNMLNLDFDKIMTFSNPKAK